MKTMYDEIRAIIARDGAVYTQRVLDGALTDEQREECALYDIAERALTWAPGATTHDDAARRDESYVRGAYAALLAIAAHLAPDDEERAEQLSRGAFAGAPNVALRMLHKFAYAPV